MTAAGFAYSNLFSKDLPPPAPRWTGFPKYNFIGGHNDPERIPAEALAKAATAVLQRDGAESRALQFRRPARLPAAARVRRRQGRAAAGDQMLGRRRADHLGLRPGHRPRQSPAARARRHGDPRRVHLWRRADQIEPPRRQRHRRAARRRGSEDRRARAASSKISGVRGYVRNTSTRSRPSRTRPARSCRGAPPETLLALDPQARRARSSRTSATPI